MFGPFSVRETAPQRLSVEWQSLGGLSGLFLRGSHFVGRQGPALVSVETVGSSGAWGMVLMGVHAVESCRPGGPSDRLGLTPHPCPLLAA